MNEFKEGDLVYVIGNSTNIHVLTKHPEIKHKLYIEALNRTYSYLGTEVRNATPNLVLATEENCTKLNELYGIYFEKPLKLDTSFDLLKFMLETTHKYVAVEIDSKLTVIHSIADDSMFCGYYEYPKDTYFNIVDLKSGCYITGYDKQNDSYILGDEYEW